MRVGDMESTLPVQPALAQSANSESRASLNSPLNYDESSAGRQFDTAPQFDSWRAPETSHDGQRTDTDYAGCRVLHASEPSGALDGITVCTSPVYSAADRPYCPIEPQFITGGGLRDSYIHMNSQSYPGNRHTRSRRTNGCSRSCASLLKQRNARRKLISLVMSTILFILALAVYLGFAISGKLWGHEVHILLIFIILILGIILCHSLIRFVMALFRYPDSGSNRIPSRAGSNGYAQPERPIHVTIVGDEEMLSESEKVTVPPPAYGLWRGSVKLNPDMLYWQRVEKPIGRDGDSSNNRSRAPRPPSYASDDGITYAVQAQPRSFTQLGSPKDQRRS